LQIQDVNIKQIGAILYFRAMKSETSTVEISESIGKVSALTMSPKNLKAVVVLAHGAGAGMKHRFMEDIAVNLAEFAIATVRYNFPYMEKGSRRPDVPAVAEKTVGAVLNYSQEKFQNIPVFLGGKSFGGRMSSQFISKHNPPIVKGIIFFGFPLHPPGKPDTQRAEHLKSIITPLLFLQGTNDALANMQLIEETCSKLSNATLVKFEGADHSFKIKKQDAVQALAIETNQWIEMILKQ
jgi:uncharacterized protein